VIKHPGSVVPPGGKVKRQLAIVAAITFALTLPLATTLSFGQNPQLSANDPIIISDTHGFNFTNYLKLLTDQVRAKWYATMPDAARQGQKGRVVVVFTVSRDGTASNSRIVAGPGTQSLDEAATAAIQSAGPFPQLPADFNDNQIVVQFAFLYNQR
jgi:TonB family protein